MVRRCTVKRHPCEQPCDDGRLRSCLVVVFVRISSNIIKFNFIWVVRSKSRDVEAVDQKLPIANSEACVRIDVTKTAGWIDVVQDL